MATLDGSAVLHLLLSRDNCSCNLCRQLSTTRMDSDLRALYEATNTDFKIVCQDREWNTHCVFLQRCPIFDKVISPTGDFQWRETVESMMTIRNFEPFEVEWLLRAIYADSWLAIYPENLKDENPNRSVMDTCVRMYTIGDYFFVPIMKEIALIALRHHTALRPEHTNAEAMSKSIPFLAELEAGIRIAWTLPRNTEEPRIFLLTMCRNTTPYLAYHQSFAKLIKDLPEFAQDLSKTLLGFSGPELPPVKRGCDYGPCAVCKEVVTLEFGQAVSSSSSSSNNNNNNNNDNNNTGTASTPNNQPDELMVFPPASLTLGAGQQKVFCSQKCFQDSLSS